MTITGPRPSRADGAREGRQRRPDPRRRTLWTLVGVESWERFSFYGMQGVLLLYLFHSAAQGGLGLTQATAIGIVGAYGSTVYLSTIAGGWLADRVAGAERVLFGSAVLIMLGHASLAVLPGATGVAVGLSAVALGSGGLKANTTAILGRVYGEDEARRDSGFALFYLGVNVGSLLGPVLTGLLQVSWGFRAAFAAAAAGMACGLVQYVAGRHCFAAQFARPPHPLTTRFRGVLAVGGVAFVAGAGALVATGVLTSARVNEVVLGAVVAATVAMFTVMLRSPQVTVVERRRVRAFIPMFLASAAFWALSQQQFTVLTVYADQQLNRHLLGWEMPVTWVQTINPVFIVILSGVFAVVWSRLGSRQPSEPAKLGFSNIVMGAAFLLFIPLATTAPNSVPLLPVIGILALFSVAELCLAPIGLSLAAAAAPRAYSSQLVALFYLSIALGTSGASELAGWYTTAHQVTYFAAVGITCMLVGLMLLAASRRLAAALHAVDQQTVADEPSVGRSNVEAGSWSRV
ncbi:peptide MFS transporter [Nocardioides sp.]|uniref:peptide MFS transporter n=1 Tax=Nocardioides sp. TaxID=35761 RepID=UPI003D0C976F